MTFTLINASAGSGKTHTLTHDIAERIKGGLQPSQLIATTFTTKAAAELLAMEADGHDGLLVTSIRPHVVWGPGDTQLVGRIVDRARSGRLPLLDDGMALIDTTYVTNAADAIVAALDRIEDVHGESFVVTLSLIHISEPTRPY